MPKVIHLALEEEPPPDMECKDKFIIKSMLIPPEKAAIPLRDLVGPFLHSPASRPIYFSYAIVGHSRGRRDRKDSLSKIEGQLSAPGIYLDNSSVIA